MTSTAKSPTRDRFRLLSIESFAVLATTAGVGLIWWMGGSQAGLRPHPANCRPADRVTSAQVEVATARVRAASKRARYTAISGSEYAAAKIGLPLSSPEHGLAMAAAKDLAVARQDLARLCAP
ncbi:MAG TPA: hypothetical protein VL460_05725 [Caulobacteraceae bacterium]|jgi:hypothetical protein|nr:hypothetical protein [Caulobacteraceae bacterium]